MNKHIFFLLSALVSLQAINAMEMDVTSFCSEDRESKSDDENSNATPTHWTIKNKREKLIYICIERKEGDKKIFVPTNKKVDKEGYFSVENSEKVFLPLDEFGTDEFVLWIYDTHRKSNAITKRVLDKKELLGNSALFPIYKVKSDYEDLSILQDCIKNMRLDKISYEEEEYKVGKKRK